MDIVEERCSQPPSTCHVHVWHPELLQSADNVPVTKHVQNYDPRNLGQLGGFPEHTRVCWLDSCTIASLFPLQLLRQKNGRMRLARLATCLDCLQRQLFPWFTKLLSSGKPRSTNVFPVVTH